MGTRRNPTYYEGDLREALLRSAVELLESRDAGAISLRMVARHTGVSHAAPAHHFKDKAALFTALAMEGFALLDKEMRTAVNRLPEDAGGLDRLRALVTAYVGFVERYPGHFQVMWRPELRHPGDPDLRAAGETTFRRVVDLVHVSQREGWGAGADPETLTFLTWSMVHGLAVLWKDGPLAEEAAGQTLQEVHHRMADLLTAALSNPVEPATTSAPA